MAYEKKRLLNEIDEAEKSADELVAAGQKLVEQGTYAKDLARATRGIVEHGPEGEHAWQQWRNVQAAWQSHNAVARRTLEILPTIELFATSTSANVSTTSTAVSSFTINSLPDDPWLHRPEIKPIVREFDRVVRARATYEHVQTLFFAYGLDLDRGGIKSPSALLADARDHLQRPASDDAPLGVAMPLREAVHQALDLLLKRRPLQEPASKTSDKVLSIARQCGKDGLPPAHFETLAETAKSLTTNLSAMKGRIVTREHMARTYFDALAFLRALLESIDRTKLRA